MYNISYYFMNKTCSGDNNGENATIHVLLDNNSTTHTLQDLYPYTDHYIQIKAFTSVGGGPYSDAEKISTKQSSNTFYSHDITYKYVAKQEVAIFYVVTIYSKKVYLYDGNILNRDIRIS